MSGPKRGTWRIRHDPTPQRLRDLQGFGQRLEEWLSRQSSFLERNLGPVAIKEAQAAIDRVDHCIRVADPSSGFDAYGAARRRFNELWEQARAVRDRQRRARQDQQRLAEERRQKELLAARQRQLRPRGDRHQRARKLAEPNTNRSEPAVAATTTSSSSSIADGPRPITSRDPRNSDSVGPDNDGRSERIAQGLLRLREAFDGMAEYDVSCLPDGRQEQIRAEAEQCQREADEALGQEDEGRLVTMLETLGRLGAEVKKETQAAQVTRAADLWRQGLTTLGYSVGVRRTEPDGTIVLEATRFPMNSIRVGLRSGSDEVQLNVNGEHDAVECVKDLNSLQNVLGQHGLELTVTDWGRGRPNDVSTWQEAHEVQGR